MSSAKASGAQAAPDSSSAKHRDHKQGQQNREFTPAQKESVDRVKKCKAHAYYEILDIKAESSDGEIKKAYRKLALLLHPDKNGCVGADEAFKMVSRAFQVLSDSQKRSQFDKFGGDPDARGFGGGGGGTPGGNPFAGFGGTPRGGRFEDEISPEDLFNMFFGGNAFGGGGGGGLGGGGTFFDLGGGPAIRIHHFGGPRPARRRARQPGEAADEQETPRSALQTILQLLPLIILVFFPLISSIFSALSGSPDSAFNRGPTIRFERQSPFVERRVTPEHRFEYYINPAEVEGWDKATLRKLDKKAEFRFIQQLKMRCEEEYEHRERKWQDSQGWLFVDQEKAKEARSMRLENCERLKRMGELRTNERIFF